MISATRYDVEIHDPSSSEHPSAPAMSFNDEFVIWISSTAMNAPNIAPKTASHCRVVTCCAGIIYLGGTDSVRPIFVPRSQVVLGNALALAAALPPSGSLGSIAMTRLW